MTTSQIHKIKRPILLIPQYHLLFILGGDSLGLVPLTGISRHVNTNPLIYRVAALVASKPEKHRIWNPMTHQYMCTPT